jgi:hypothetical protein
LPSIQARQQVIATKRIARGEPKPYLLDHCEYCSDDAANLAIRAGEFKLLASQELPNDSSDIMLS